ncbi:MAG: hypothetical protein QOE35_196, partial [Actinomycetota bacterium]
MAKTIENRPSVGERLAKLNESVQGS